MKQIVMSLLLWVLLSPTVSAQTNRALFVAIDKYPERSGWNDIHATNDSEIILPMLRNNGFKNSDIVNLLNAKATKRAIIAELKKLISQSKRGDYVYIHFSCHGQLMADDNGDEPDGYDEALIPYDAKRRFSKGVYEGENHLRDDELGVYLDKIRAKAGGTGNLTVVLDACHSATANRDGDDETYTRGTTYIFAPDDYEPTIGKDNAKLKSNGLLAPVQIWSACQADETNYEYRDPQTKRYYGSLSFALCKAINESKSNNSTIKEVNNIIARNIETLFKGRKYKQQPYLETTNERKIFKIGR